MPRAAPVVGEQASRVFENKYSIKNAEDHLQEQRANGTYGVTEKDGLSNELILGKVDDWIKLLIATMKNQNPDEKIKATEISQQFNSFAQTMGTKNITDMLKDYMKVLGTNQVLQAASQLDKAVELKASHFYYNPQQPTQLNFMAPEGAVKAAVVITDEHNRTLKIVEADVVPGKNSVVWDGIGIDGKKVNNGKYLFRVQAVDSNGKIMTAADGKELSLATTISGIATGSTVKDGQVYMTVGGGDFIMSSLLSVQADSTLISRQQQQKSMPFMEDTIRSELLTGTSAGDITTGLSPEITQEL